MVKSAEIMELDKWVKIVISQKLIGDKFMLTIMIDLELLSSTENENPGEFSNVDVYASAPGLEQPGYIRGLAIKTNLYGEQNQ